MKAKSFLFSLLCMAAILVGCEKKEAPIVEEDPTGGVKSYVSVSVKSSISSRLAPNVTDGGYVEGEVAENKIQSIDFYFFDGSGNPFKFNSPVTEGSTASYTNMYTVTEGLTTTSSTGNVEEVVSVTMPLQHNMGDYPASVVAIVNGTQRFQNLPIADFRTHIFNNYATSNGFLMSNSVYKDASGAEVFSTPLSESNFALSEADAKLNPINIYVERTAVRVEVAQKTAVEKYETGYKTLLGVDSVMVYAKIVGWDIVTTAKHAYTVKKIDLTWPDQINGMTWNMPADFRSYWADASWVADSLNKQFAYNGLKNQVGLGYFDYCLENTTEPEYLETSGVHDVVASRSNVTKAVIAAVLLNATGDTMRIANWYGQDYTIDGLKVAIANSLKNKMFYTEGGNWYPIKAEHIRFVQGSGLPGEEKSYEVYCQLTDAARAYAWASHADGTGAIVNEDEDIYIRQNVEVAKIWNGRSYYMVNIQHMGTTEMNGTDYLPAYYGVVRNHAYQITFGAVKGLGTPVFDPGSLLPEPVLPDDTESYIDAEINVLSWHLIQQEVTLQ